MIKTKNKYKNSVPAALNLKLLEGNEAIAFEIIFQGSQWRKDLFFLAVGACLLGH